MFLCSMRCTYFSFDHAPNDDQSTSPLNHRHSPRRLHHGRTLTGLRTMGGLLRRCPHRFPPACSSAFELMLASWPGQLFDLLRSRWWRWHFFHAPIVKILAKSSINEFQ